MNVINRSPPVCEFQNSFSLSFQRKTKRNVFLLLFVLTPVHLNWPSYATGKCYRSPRQLISTMIHWWLYKTIHSLTIFKWKMRNSRLDLRYLSFFVQYMIMFWNEPFAIIFFQYNVFIFFFLISNNIPFDKTLILGPSGDVGKNPFECTCITQSGVFWATNWVMTWGSI